MWLCVVRLIDDYKLCLPMCIDFSTNVEYQLRHNDVQQCLKIVVTFMFEVILIS
jgi:hypothetical protein